MREYLLYGKLSIGEFTSRNLNNKKGGGKEISKKLIEKKPDGLV